MKSRWGAFLLTFITYCSFHANRKSYSLVKGNIQEWDSEVFSNKYFGLLDSCFMLSYSIGLVLMGFMADTINKKKLLILGMELSGIIMGLFALLLHLEVKLPGLYMFLICMNGIVQSVGWPITVSILEEWFSESRRAKVFGIWCSNSNVGNIMGSLLIVAFLNINWHLSLAMPALFIISTGFVNIACLKTRPETAVDVEINIDGEIIYEKHTTNKRYNLSLFKDHLLGMPRPLVYQTFIWSYIYGCIKFVNYTFFFWLPLYMEQSMGISSLYSDLYSNVYDIGGIAGGFVGGYLMDKFPKRFRHCSLLVLLLCASIFLRVFMEDVGNFYIINGFIFVIGLTISGPSDMIGSVIPVDLASRNASYKKYTAFVVGIVDGIASFLSGMGQILVGYVSQEYGWDAVFYILIGNLLGSVFFISIMAIKNYREETR